VGGKFKLERTNSKFQLPKEIGGGRATTNKTAGETMREKKEKKGDNGREDERMGSTVTGE